MTHAEETARAALANGQPHMSNIQAIKNAIAQHETAMEASRANNPHYFQGQNETDTRILISLEEQLAAAQAEARR